MTDAVTNMRHFKSAGRLEHTASNGEFTGWAARYGEVDLMGDVITPGAFAASLEHHAKRGTLPAMLLHHDQTQPVGRWLSFEERPEGLLARGIIDTESDHGAEAYRMLQVGVLDGLSVGFRPIAADIDDDGVRHIREAELAEVSLVAVPAALSARVLQVKSAIADGKLPTEREFERVLRDLGLSRKQAQTIVAEGFRAMVKTDDSVPDTTVQALKALHTKLLGVSSNGA